MEVRGGEEGVEGRLGEGRGGEGDISHSTTVTTRCCFLPGQQSALNSYACGTNTI